jgi:hypothetical protein
MSLPTSYLTSTKNLADILAAMQSAQAPKKFTHTFLQGLGYKGSSDRLIIGVLKALGFLNANGEPTQRYFAFLDQSQSARVLGDAVQEAYADLYQVNTKAHELSATEVKNKLKTLTQGQSSDSVLDKMAMTFKALASQSDFTGPSRSSSAFIEPPTVTAHESKPVEATLASREQSHPIRLGGLVYNIQIHLPETRDTAVYDALFKSLKEHILR